jgi:alginate O-acetyltransferase complex protein AlgI
MVPPGVWGWSSQEVWLVLFCSAQFLGFFLVVFITYWLLPWHRGRVLLLLAASIFFYACWNRWLALVLCVSTLGDYLLARSMEATANSRVRKLLLLTSLIGNLGLLCYFKYANFFLQSLSEAAGAFGLTLELPILQVMLPVGISFYTFEAINYTVDVYRGKVRAARDLTHFMLFILFFPHLVAGPIVRAKAFLPLVARRKRTSWLRAHAGVMLILLGLIKKLAIADRMALYVDPVFASPEGYASVTLWLAAVAYAIQIYCDFSGYSDMALGLAHLLGYHLAPNFNMPFLSANIAELWRRWHMSLSSWIRDYLFIPLGGSRGSRLQTYRNLLITFALCGLWHGAGWTYVVWGLLNGVMLVIHAAFKPWCEARPRLAAALQTVPGTVLRVALTFTCFCVVFVVFRSPDFTIASTMLRRMFTAEPGALLPMEAHGLYLTFAAVALGHILGQRKLGQRLWDRLPAPLRGLGLGAALTLALVLAPGTSKAFIYFQF